MGNFTPIFEQEKLRPLIISVHINSFVNNGLILDGKVAKPKNSIFLVEFYGNTGRNIFLMSKAAVFQEIEKNAIFCVSFTFRVPIQLGPIYLQFPLIVSTLIPIFY